jgi:hypothetical protein
MANRYDSGTVSKFNPLSFQEIMFAPTAMRVNHDASIKRAEENALKIDSLDEHLEESMKLKQDMNNKIRTQVDLINREGFNPNTTQGLTTLNREFQDLSSSTGRAGQINAAKVIEAIAKKKFYDSDDAKSNSEEVNQMNWEKFRNKYTGYNEDGSIKNIGDFSAVKYVDEQKMVSELRVDLGMTESEFKQASSMLNDTGNQNGTRFTVNTAQATSKGSNQIQLQQMADYLNRRVSDTTDPFRKSLEYTGRDVNKVWSQMTSHMNMMKKDLTSNAFSRELSNVDYYTPDKSGNEDPDSGDYEGVNVETVDITSNTDSLNILTGNITSKLVNPPRNLNTMSGEDITEYYQKVRNNNPKAIKTQYIKSNQYRVLANNVRRTLNMQDKALDSQEIQDAVVEYLRENKDAAITNRYVDPNTNRKALLFASKELTGKENKANASSLIMERAQQGSYSIRTVEGEEIKQEDLGDYEFTYSGDMTAKSVIRKENGSPIFNNPKQNIGARRGLLKNTETGKTVPVYVSRSDDDFNTPQWKGMNIVNGITKITDSQPGIYHAISVKAFKKDFGIKKFEVKYNKNSETYNVSYTKRNGVPVDKEFSDTDFQEYILNTQL